MKHSFKFCCLAVAAIALSAALFTGCKENDSKEPYQIKLFEGNPYLAEVWWGEDYDPAVATEMLLKKYNAPLEFGGCSSWHKDNFHGRNIDWMMRDYATLIIHLPKSEKVKYASVGLIAGNPLVLKQFLDENTTIPEELRTFLPASVVDGMNECGVAINHNIVPYDEKEYETNGDIASMMVCRYVLDNCASAQEAVEMLGERKVTQALVSIAHDYSHFFISDPTCSYVVEWIDNEFVATEFMADGNGNYVSENGQKAIMTNYFVGAAEKYGFKTNDFFKNHPSGAGIERAEVINEKLETAGTLEDHLDICKAVWYRQFCQGNAFWPTENSGFYGYDAEKDKAYWFYPDASEIHWMDNDDIYAAAVALAGSDNVKPYFDTFNDTGDQITVDNDYWFTQHSVVYDTKALKGYVIVQEGIFSDKVIEISID